MSISSPDLVEEQDELAVITCLFTPQPHERRRRNLEQFTKQFRRSLYVAELSYDNHPWSASSDTNTLHFRGGPLHLLWQKERLLNLLIEQLPPHITRVAWVDADVLFLDRRWMARACEQLKRFAVVQLFDTVVHLDADGIPSAQSDGLIASAAHHRASAFAQRKGAAGFAWAARREVIAEVGLMDFMILGGADMQMACGFAGVSPPEILAQQPFGLRLAIESWNKRVYNLMGGLVGHLQGTIEHLFHGSLGTRGYLQRYEVLRRANFDPAKDISIDETGLHAWKTSKPEFHAEVASYFARRATGENA